MSFFEHFSDELISKKVLHNVIRSASWPTLASFFSLSGSEGRANGKSGNNKHAIIYRQEGIKMGDGMTYTVPISGQLDYLNAVMDKEQLSGTEGSLAIYDDMVRLHKLRQAVRLDHTELLKAQSLVDVEAALKTEFESVYRKRLEYDTWGSMCLQGRYGRITGRGYIHNFGAANGKPSWHRMHSAPAGAAGVGSITGADQTAYNNLQGVEAILARGGAGNANVVAQQKAIGFETLLYLKRMAEDGGKEPLAERLITPTDVFLEKGLPSSAFVFMAEPLIMSRLLADPLIQAQGSNLGKNALLGAPHHMGGASAYRGTIEGIHLFENPWLSVFRLNGDGNTKIAQSYLCGASAVGQGFMAAPKIITKSEDYEDGKNWGMSYIRGQKALKSPSEEVPGTFVDNALITYLNVI